MPQLNMVALTQSDIMIVDDNAANLKLLEGILRQQSHRVRSFPLGRLALAAASRNPPDLILLDINMPEMNGYEVCEHLKANQELSSIPVIFLTALNETPDKVRAFRAGAADYISKPFQIEEVRARVETHLALHRFQRSLRLENQRLEEAVEERTRELAQANERLTILDRSKGDFLKLISHEFRTPLTGLFGVTEIILAEMPHSAELRSLQSAFDESRQRILSILDDALLLTQIQAGSEQFRPTSISLNVVLRRAIAMAAELARFRGVILEEPADTGAFLFGDEELTVRALQRLFETAIKFSQKGETVRCWYDSESRKITIHTQSGAIPVTALPRFFDLFSIGEAITPGGDLGLGPPMASRIFGLFGGSVSAANRHPDGIELVISLRENTDHPRRCQ